MIKAMKLSRMNRAITWDTTEMPQVIILLKRLISCIIAHIQDLIRLIANMLTK